MTSCVALQSGHSTFPDRLSFAVQPAHNVWKHGRILGSTKSSKQIGHSDRWRTESSTEDAITRESTRQHWLTAELHRSFIQVGQSGSTVVSLKSMMLKTVTIQISLVAIARFEITEYCASIRFDILSDKSSAKQYS